jgi:cytochrome P450
MNLSSILILQNNNQDTREVHDSLFAVLSSSKVPCRDVEGRLAQRTLATDEIIAHMLTLLSEVHPTTTALIQFILYELACHQDCQDKLYDEIQNMSSQVNYIVFYPKKVKIHNILVKLKCVYPKSMILK